MEMTLAFPGGVAVEAHFRGHVVRTDQPAPLGHGSAPSPFDLFLASLATCSGYYALRFCQERQLSTHGLGVRLATEKAPGAAQLERVVLSLSLPEGFPEKYQAAIVRAIDQCAVKRNIYQNPAIEIEIV